MRVARVPAIVGSLLVMLPLLAQAVSFPDVKSSNVFRQAIEGLAEQGVISGNPDGTFRPDDPVNRAAMLKMLYKATGKTPAAVSSACFSDVAADAWYATYVCDAVAQGYVKGYGDGTFKPARPVTRAEAIKMTLVVYGLGLTFPASGAADVYTDVPADSWFATYVSNALSFGVLPIAGQEGPAFLPNEPLSRGEAAAYIWNVLNVQIEHATSSSSSSEAAAASSTASSQASSRKSATFDDTGSTADVSNVSFPFDDVKRFSAKKPFSYRFTLTAATVVDVTSGLNAGESGVLSCTLFKLEKNGLSTEYYIGYKEGTSCYLRTALTAGDYQLQLQSTTADAYFTVSAKVGQGDGNDGLSQAAKLQKGTVRVEVLEGNDLEDWYTFTVATQQEMKLVLTSTSQLRCLVYPGADVDLFGFDEPSCGTTYLYPVGTYHVSIGHASPRAARQTYSLELR